MVIVIGGLVQAGGGHGPGQAALKKLPIGRAEPKFGPKFCARSPLFWAKIGPGQKID